jgi:hypothetical protein
MNLGSPEQPFDRLRTSFHVTLALIVLAPVTAAAQVAPRLQLDFLNRLSAQAKETVDVTIDPSMMQMALGLLGGDKVRDDPTVKSMLAGLQGIYVKVFQFEKEGVYNAADVERVRAQLKDSRWKRTVSVQSKKEQVEVYMWNEGDVPGGIAVLVAEPTELVVVNVVGKVDLRVLGALSGMMGIPGNLPMLPEKPAPDRRE